MTLSAFHTLSPIDGRYFSKTQALRPFFSEYGLTYYRLRIEIYWLKSLAANPEIPDISPLSDFAHSFLDNILTQFNELDVKTIKAYEKQTNHDVKAVEYYLKEKIVTCPELSAIDSFIHFACTSEDINNLAYALMIKEALTQVIQPTLTETVNSMTLLGKKYASIPMLGRTHGQPATPTTLGKELINFSARLKRPVQQLTDIPIVAKCNGAVGNYNAHIIAYPNVDWRQHCAQFVTELGLSFNAYTTQIEPHDGIAEMAHLMIRINNILLDYTRDLWSYISLGYFTQQTIANEVGSSTMPHKINPIDFENAEGNLGLSNALFNHFANKLTQSRLQRDLSDSTVLRNLGVAFAYALIAYQSIAKGNAKLHINDVALKTDLNANWEILTEAIQTVMRRYGLPNAYEQMRDLSRGHRLDQTHLTQFINTLAIPDDAKQRLLALTPERYTGLASTLVKAFS